MHEMDVVESEILSLLKDFCKIVPLHIDKWRDVLDHLLNKVKGVVNMSEQLQYVSEANIEHMPNFKLAQKGLRFNILTSIEEDMKFVRDSIDKLSRFNTQIKDKLIKLETASLELDWEKGDCTLLQGTPVIPPLGRLLQDALQFYTFFESAYKNMQNSTKRMSYLHLDNMKHWESTFMIELESNQCVNGLLALTQYVDNDVLT